MKKMKAADVGTKCSFCAQTFFSPSLYFQVSGVYEPAFRLMSFWKDFSPQD
jgi:hypothetical protein